MIEAAGFLNSTVEGYLQELSARKMAPGGGSVAALTAALGAGLNLMVINYSRKEDDSDEVSSFFADARKKQEESLRKLSLLIDEDCTAFKALMDALSSGNDAQEEYMTAAAAPMKVCRACHASMDITATLVKNSNKNLVTDIGCAAHTLKAAFFSAGLNVKTNLRHIKDLEFAEQVGDDLKIMEIDINRIAKEIEDRVQYRA